MDQVHQALYRKWRPKTFDDVCGQEHITSILKYEASQGKTSHAYLFCGSRGTGKTSCAKILAKAVNCLDLQNGNPCGKCQACISIDNGSATDVLEMDAASNNGVDYIRDIREEVVYSPAMLKSRVYIIDEVHMLTPNAFNALLKTLEEPPERVVFILATTEFHKIPSTILSRCQRFDFKRIPSNVISDRLKHISENEGIKISDDAAYLIARLSQGGMRDAISLLELCSGSGNEITDKTVLDCAGAGGRETVFSAVKAILNCDYQTIFSIISGIYLSSKDISIFWQELMSYYRDMLVCKSCKNFSEHLELTEKEAQELSDISAHFSYEVLLYHCGIMDEALTNMQRNSSNARLVAEFALLRMCEPKLDTSQNALLARIKNLELAEPTAEVKKPSAKEGAEAVKEPSRPFEKAPVKKPEAKPEKPVEQPAPKVSAEPSSKSVLRPMGSWIEIVNAVAIKDRGLSSIMQGATAYADDAGRIRIKVNGVFAKNMIGSDANKAYIASVASSVNSAQYTADDIIIEVEKKADTDGFSSIDEIIARKDEL